MSKGDPKPGGEYSWRRICTTFREDSSLPFPLALLRTGDGATWLPVDLAYIGMIAEVNGDGHAVAALDSLRHRPVVLAGLLGKVLGPIRFLSAVI